jgi:hypothetical protein
MASRLTNTITAPLKVPFDSLSGLLAAQAYGVTGNWLQEILDAESLGSHSDSSIQSTRPTGPDTPASPHLLHVAPFVLDPLPEEIAASICSPMTL